MYHVLYDMYVLCLHAACIVMSAVLRRKINEMLSSNYRASSCRSMCLHDVVVVVAQAQVPLSHLTCCERLRGCGVPCAGPHTRLCHLSVSQWLESGGCVPGDPDQAPATLPLTFRDKTRVVSASLVKGFTQEKKRRLLEKQVCPPPLHQPFIHKTCSHSFMIWQGGVWCTYTQTHHPW